MDNVSRDTTHPSSHFSDGEGGSIGGGGSKLSQYERLLVEIDNETGGLGGEEAVDANTDGEHGSGTSRQRIIQPSPQKEKSSQPEEVTGGTIRARKATQPLPPPPEPKRSTSTEGDVIGETQQGPVRGSQRVSGSSKETLKEDFKKKKVNTKLAKLLQESWEDLQHLDPVIEKVKNEVQKTLLDEGYSEKIVESKTNKKARKELGEEIEHLTLAELYNNAPLGDDERAHVITQVRDEILGLGPIEVLWNDESITEVLCNGPEDIWIEQYGKLKKVKGARFRNRKQLQEVCEKILLPINRKLDIKSPLADGRLPDGSRVNGVHVRVSPNGPDLTIRKFPSVNLTLKDLVEIGSINEEMALTIAWLIRNKATMLVSGGTGTGKLLTLDTKIPTPSGWATMGDLNVGDVVYGRNGEPCQVTAVSNIDPQPTLYAITFSDGQRITADLNHQWVVEKHEHINGVMRVTESVKTTQKILDEGIFHPDGGSRFSIRTTKPVKMGTDLTDAYNEQRNTLKVPLVNSTENIHTSTRNAHVLATEMFHLTHTPHKTNETFNVPHTLIRGCLKTRLSFVEEVVNIWDPKYITRTHTPEGTVVGIFIPNTSARETFTHIVRSLGVICTAHPAPLTLTAPAPPSTHPAVHTHLTAGTLNEPNTNNTTDNQTHMWVTFNETQLYKKNTQTHHNNGERGTTQPNDHLFITHITPVDSEPGKCIQVDSPDSTYLIEGFIPTHNTTMLNALSAAIPYEERIITIEDSLELRLDPQAHVVSLEAQPEDPAGGNAISIRQLVKNALRMRPNRIIVGEVRDEAALEMLQACNTGHEGSMSTIHANGPEQAVSRLAVMVAQGGDFPADKVNWLVGSAIDIIITLKRDRNGPRRIDGIYEVPEVSEGETLTTIPLWEWVRTGTDETTGDPIGEYAKRNNMSEHLHEKLELKWHPKPTWEEVENNFKT